MSELDAIEVQGLLDDAIDAVLDALTAATEAGVEVDPLQTIIARMQARGTDLEAALGDASPMVRMLLGGMLG